MTNVHDILNALRTKARERPAPDEAVTPRSWGEHAADAVASVVGSWRFDMIQSALQASWLQIKKISSSSVDP